MKGEREKKDGYASIWDLGWEREHVSGLAVVAAAAATAETIFFFSLRQSSFLTILNLMRRCCLYVV